MKNIILLLYTFSIICFAQQKSSKQLTMQYEIYKANNVVDNVLINKKINRNYNYLEQNLSNKILTNFGDVNLFNIVTKRDPTRAVITKHNYAYVNSRLENCINIIDLKSKIIVKTIHTPFPSYLYYNDINDEVYVVNYTDTYNDYHDIENCWFSIGISGFGSQITIIDASLMNIKDSIKIDGIFGAKKIFPSANDSIFFVATDDEIIEVDIKNKTILKILKTVQFWPYTIYDKKRDRIFLSRSKDNKIFYWDLIKNSIFPFIEGISSYSMWYDEGRDRLITSDGHVIDLETGEIIHQFQNTSFEEIIIDTTNKIIVSTDRYRINIIDAENYSILKTFESNCYKGKIITDRNLLCLVKGGASEDGISYVRQQYEIQIIDLKNYIVRNFSVSDSLIECGWERWIDVSSDNKYLLVTNNALNSVSIIDLSDLETLQSFNNGLTNLRITDLAVNANDHIFAGTLGGGIFRSTDNGNHWVAINNGLKDSNVSCMAINSNNDLFVTTFSEGIFHSSDNGDNWTAKNNGLMPSYWHRIAINADGYIFVSTANGSIIRSKDYGENWEWSNNGLPSSLISCIAFNSYGQIFVGTYGNGIFQSIDNGDNWFQINNSLPSSLSINVILVDSNNNIFLGTGESIFGFITPSSGKGIFQSTDNGNSWMQISDESFISSLAVNKSNQIFAANKEGIFRLDKIGDNWVQINNSLTSEDVNSIVFNSSNFLYTGTNFSGIFGFQSPITSVANKSHTLPLKFLLKQNYPNPFNSSTTISYSIPKLSFITLKVYDILGKEVTSLVNEEKAPGSYEVKFNASNLSSGIYFYKLQAGSFIDTKKFIILK